MASTRRKQQEETRFQIMRLLKGNSELSQRELAQAVGLSVGGINSMLAALIGHGYIQIGEFTASNDKRRSAYILTPKGTELMAKLTRTVLASKIEQCELLKKEIVALTAETNNDAQ